MNSVKPLEFPRCPIKKCPRQKQQKKTWATYIGDGNSRRIANPRIEMAMEASQPTTELRKPLRCIVKIGGAAITQKGVFETLNEEVLKLVSQQLKEAMMKPLSTRSMDWSRQDGTTNVSLPEQVIDQELNMDPFVVIHGAGSFGHFQANLSGVQKGGLSSSAVIAGFVATRISVTSLNLKVVRALAKDGIPSIGLSPLALGWSTCQRHVENANTSEISRIINARFVPVLHGDGAFDSMQGCTILSGDVIMRKLAQELKPQYAVFLTNVPGVFDRPPTDANAVLLKEIIVHEDGSWSVLKPLLPCSENAVQTDVANHDTTGGMAAKIKEAALIARLGVNVFIVEAGTEHSLKALKGQVTDETIDSWVGTLVRFTKHC